MITMPESIAVTRQKMRLIRDFQRKVRREGLPVECNAFREPILLRGRVVKINVDAIKVRLCEPRYWRAKMSTNLDWRCGGYEPFKVDVENGTVVLTWHAHDKIDDLLRRAWMHAKRFGNATAEPYKPLAEWR